MVVLGLSTGMVWSCADLPLAPITGSVSYELAWGADEVALGNQGWQTTNDLGYAVEVTSGYLVTMSVELVACPDEATSDPFATVTDGLRLALAPRQAFAGHSLGGEEPTHWVINQSDSLIDLKELSVATALEADATYCSVHVLFAQAVESTLDLPDSPDMAGVTLYLAGTATHPDGVEAPFEVATGLANGVLVELADPLPGDATVLVRVERDLQALVDGIDFAGDPADYSLQLARNLASATHIEITW